MEVRVKFSADIYIEGESMKEIREKFENMQLSHRMHRKSVVQSFQNSYWLRMQIPMLTYKKSMTPVIINTFALSAVMCSNRVSGTITMTQGILTLSVQNVIGLVQRTDLNKYKCHIN